jgi:hypothetical protein
VAAREAPQRRAGVHLGTAPVGYRHIKGPSPICGGEGGKLERDERFGMIRDALQLAAEAGEGAAVAYLRKHRLGGEHWNTANWRRTVKRRVYLGETCWIEREVRREPVRDDDGRLVHEESGRAAGREGTDRERGGH